MRLLMVGRRAQRGSSRKAAKSQRYAKGPGSRVQGLGSRVRSRFLDLEAGGLGRRLDEFGIGGEAVFR
jgi:hypothetical protein